MEVQSAAWLVILVGLVFANLPFVNQRLFLLLPLTQGKSFFVRLLEWLLGYFLTGAFALLLENSIGSIFSQGWEFYAVTLCLMLVFAFPGFVYRYLLKR